MKLSGSGAASGRLPSRLWRPGRWRVQPVRDMMRNDDPACVPLSPIMQQKDQARSDWPSSFSAASRSAI
jgi:hypothetical protein